MTTTTLYNERQGREVVTRMWQAIKPLLERGQKLSLTVKKEKRSLPQNDHLQKLVRNIGLKIGYADHDRLRVLLTEQWRFETERPPVHVPSFDGQRMVDVSNRTSNKDKEECSEFIEWLIAKDADL